MEEKLLYLCDSCLRNNRPLGVIINGPAYNNRYSGGIGDGFFCG